MLENIFYCFRSQKVIQCLVLKRPVQLFTPLSPLYRGGSQVFHSDLKEVSLAFCKARNGNQSFFFSFQGRKLYPFCSVHHFWHYLHSCIQIALRWGCLWSKSVGLHGGAFFFNPVFFLFFLTQFSLMRLNLPPWKQLFFSLPVCHFSHRLETMECDS